MFVSVILLSMLSADLAGCVPARWPAANVESLALLKDSPVNCLLLDEREWAGGFLKAAHGRGLRLLAVIDGADSENRAKRALSLSFDGLVVEGDLAAQEREAVHAAWRGSGRPVIELPLRVKIDLAHPDRVIGTCQGLWPGIKMATDGAAGAKPTGGPWIETNAGFLRFLRASVPPSTELWIANRPPEKQVLGAERYVQAIGDAAMSGARWVLALDSGFSERLWKGDAKALAAWKKINGTLRFYEEHKELRVLSDYSRLALVQDASSGALVSGGILDMIAARHIPVLVTPAGRLATTSFGELDALVNVAPAALSAGQKEILKAVARKGATVVNGPPGWKMTLDSGAEFTFSGSQVQTLDEIWRDMNTVLGRRNFAVRIFGAPSMRSNLKAAPGGRKLALHLVNYSNYPAEQITVRVAGQYDTATLLTPQGSTRLEVYGAEDEAGVDIDRIEDAAILVLEARTAAAQPKR